MGESQKLVQKNGWKNEEVHARICITAVAHEKHTGEFYLLLRIFLIECLE